MREELEQFVASLAIPTDRKAIVLAELLDHVACAREAAVRDGHDPEEAARAAIGELALLRRSLEAVEPAFQITRRHAIARGLVASLVVAFAIDRGGPIMMGIVGALVAVAIVALLAPTHVLALLRAELRAPRVRGAISGVPIGPALTYIVTVMSAPFVVWIGLIVTRVYGGLTDFETPLSAFAVMTAACLLLLVEGLRARHAAVA